MMFSYSMSCALKVIPRSYTVLTNVALTIRPVRVVVVDRQFRIVSMVSSGTPVQFLDTSLKRRCSIGFHLEAPPG